MRLIYDLDDDLFDLPRSHPDAATLRPRARVVQRLVQEAGTVWVSTPALARRLPMRGPMRSWCPTRSMSGFGSMRPDADAHRGGPMRVLFMGTATHDADFALVEPALERLHAAFPGRIHFDMLGVSARANLPGWVHRPALPPSATASYPGFVSWMCRHHGWDVGIAPLVDTPFTAAKSAIKAMDYAALGLAVVASDVGPYRDALGLGERRAAGAGTARGMDRGPGPAAAKPRIAAGTRSADADVVCRGGDPASATGNTGAGAARRCRGRGAGAGCARRAARASGCGGRRGPRSRLAAPWLTDLANGASPPKPRDADRWPRSVTRIGFQALRRAERRDDRTECPDPDPHPCAVAAVCSLPGHRPGETIGAAPLTGKGGLLSGSTRRFFVPACTPIGHRARPVSRAPWPAHHLCARLGQVGLHHSGRDPCRSAIGLARGHYRPSYPRGFRRLCDHRNLHRPRASIPAATPWRDHRACAHAA